MPSEDVLIQRRVKAERDAMGVLSKHGKGERTERLQSLFQTGSFDAHYAPLAHVEMLAELSAIVDELAERLEERTAAEPEKKPAAKKKSRG